MKYTALYGHMEKESDLKVGDTVINGDKIGTIGNTGKSEGIHLHFGLIEGTFNRVFRMSEIIITKDLMIQLTYFMDYALFNFKLLITSYFGDPDYKDENDKLIFHTGYDVVPIDRKITTDHYNFYWNRSKVGKVLAKGFDIGYGYYILIGYKI